MNLKYLFLICLIFISLQGFGNSSFYSLDQKSQKAPESLTDYKQIADYLTHDLQTDTEKARAIYNWISHNIQYRLSQIYEDITYHSVDEIIEDALKTRQGVCQHYAELFHAMGNSVGLKSYVIAGYARNKQGKIGDLGHAWNAIRIDSKYYLIDVTLAAGYLLDGKYVHQFRDEYFLIAPENFIQTHMPFDPMWQFLSNPINNREFIAQDFSKLKESGNFAYNDSIQLHPQQSKLRQLELSTRRIRANGIQNKLIQKQLNDNILQITTLKYNLAIDTLNYGVENYNLYITHKNKQFRNPNLEDSYIRELIENAENSIHAANEMLNGLLSPSRELNTLITDARKKMAIVIPDLKMEKEFVEKYLKTLKPLRMFLFMKN